MIDHEAIKSLFPAAKINFKRIGPEDEQDVDRVALVDASGRVVNIVAVEKGATFDPGKGLTAVPFDGGAAIGAIWDGAGFERDTPPSEPVGLEKLASLAGMSSDELLAEIEAHRVAK